MLIRDCKMPCKLHVLEDAVHLGTKTKLSGYRFGIHGSDIASVFKPLVQILRLFGHCPLSCDRRRMEVEKTHDGTISTTPPTVTGAYKFQWKSWWTGWSACGLLLYFSMWAIVPIEGMTNFRLWSPEGLVF